MVKNIPTPNDFFEAGNELLNFAWDVVAELLKYLDQSQVFGVDPEEVSDAYWMAARRRLSTALAMTQQGVEFILKGKIVAVSPYLLLADPPAKWPSPEQSPDTDFSSFRTIDAQDLVRVHDTFAITRLDSEFVAKFNELREKRNRIMHSIDKNVEIHVQDVLASFLFVHQMLIPDRGWAETRRSFLENGPECLLGNTDSVVNDVAWELELVLKVLAPAQVKRYFGIDKKQRRYTCPSCLSEADKDLGFDRKLALLLPADPGSTSLSCLMCGNKHTVQRDDCTNSGCKGNVISDEGVCLTCERYSEPA